MRQSIIPYGLLILLMLLINVTATAAVNESTSEEYKLTVTAPKRVSVGDNIKVTYSIITDKDILSDLFNAVLGHVNESAKRIFGPARGTDTSYSNIGGKISISNKINYTYEFKALKEGTFTTPTLQITYKDSLIEFTETKTVLIESSPDEVEPDNEEAVETEIDINSIFLELKPDKNEIALGDSIRLSLTLYTKYSVKEFYQLKDQVFDDAFVFIDDSFSKLTNGEKDGQSIYYANIRNYTVTPLKKGKYHIPPIEASVTIVVYNIADFGFYTGFNPTCHDIILKTKPFTFTVK